MDNKQWKLLRDRLTGEVQQLLAPLVTDDWNTETSRKANAILSRRAEKLMGEMNLPAVPDGHRLFAKIWFNDKVAPPKMKIAVYHVPWNKGGARTSRAQPARKPVAVPLKAEDPLGVCNKAANAIERYEYEWLMDRIQKDKEGMFDDPMRLRDVKRAKDIAPVIDPEVPNETHAE